MVKSTAHGGSKRLFKKAVVLIVSLVLTCTLFNSCGQFRVYQPVTDANNLEGRRIGVALACGPDYLFTNRDDITLMRYNSVSGAITALKYHQVDAIAVERQTAFDIVNSVSGLRYIEEAYAQDALGLILTPGNYELLDEINSFIAEFVKTTEYADLISRSNDPEGYTFKEVPLIGGDRVLHVGIVSDAYPFSYPNFETDSFEGTDVEFICHFANAHGYNVVFHDGTWESMEFGVQYGEYDIGCGGISELYREDFELSDCALMTASFMPVDIVIIVRDDQ